MPKNKGINQKTHCAIGIDDAMQGQLSLSNIETQLDWNTNCKFVYPQQVREVKTGEGVRMKMKQRLNIVIMNYQKN